MLFICKIPTYSLILIPGRQLTNPLNGLPGEVIQTKIAKFVKGRYETDDRGVIELILKKMAFMRANRMSVPFSIYPDHEADADRIWNQMQERESSGQPTITDAVEKPELVALTERLAQLEAENARLKAKSVDKTKVTSKAKGGKKT